MPTRVKARCRKTSNLPSPKHRKSFTAAARDQSKPPAKRRNLEEIKKRLLKNNISIRLGCSASNLMGLESFSKMPNNQKAIQDLIEESKFFIEWVTPGLGPHIQMELLNIQIQIALWNYLKDHRRISKVAGKLAEKILKLSG